jgi:hypothetical protein
MLGTAQLTGAGTAEINLLFGVGTHNIAAVYAGSSTNESSTSSAQTLTITGVGTYVSNAFLSSNGNAGNYTLSGSVAGYGITPLGGETVSFLDASNGNSNIGSTSLGASSFEAIGPSTYPAGNSPQFVVVSDFNRDGIPDLAVANWSSDGVDPARQWRRNLWHVEQPGDGWGATVCGGGRF